MAAKVPFQERKRMTNLGEALMETLQTNGAPVISSYTLFLLLWRLFETGGVKYLRGEHPSQTQFHRTRSLLRKEGVIRRDPDYTRLWRVMVLPDVGADELVCFADPFVYISHISAMQRYGLTNRRSKSLHLTQPAPALVKEMLAKKREEDFGVWAEDPEIFIEPLTATHHPWSVRGRSVSCIKTKHPGFWTQVRGGQERIGTIGQTFVDMLESPDLCGGMIHVLDVWRECAAEYTEEIVGRLEKGSTQIQKIRAGYILEEMLGIEDSRVKSWKEFAQRGGSRKLDPSAPFIDRYSSEWMISINVG